MTLYYKHDRLYFLYNRESINREFIKHINIISSIFLSYPKML